MKGLLIKDFKMIKRLGIFLILISAVFFIMSVLSDGVWFFSYQSILLLSVLPTTIIAYDEQANWHKYEIILPISRAKIVLEKYLLTLIMVIPAIIIENIILYFNKNINASDILNLASMMLLMGTIIPIVILPITFRFGYLKSKFISLFIICFIAAAMGSITSAASEFTQANFVAKMDSYMLVVITIILFIASFGLSVALYKKREI